MLLVIAVLIAGFLLFAVLEVSDFAAQSVGNPFTDISQDVRSVCGASDYRAGEISLEAGQEISVSGESQLVLEDEEETGFADSEDFDCSISIEDGSLEGERRYQVQNDGSEKVAIS